MSLSTIEPRMTREEVALRELGVTEVSRRTKVALVALFLATIASVPLVQHVHGLFAGQAPRAWRIFTTVPTERNFHEYERELEDESVVGAWLMPRVQALLVRSGVGNEQAYLGESGLLYYRPGVDYVTGPPFLETRRLRARSLGGESWEAPPAPDPIPAIVDFRDQLRARGIELLLVPTTVKPQLAQKPPLHNPSHAAWRDALAAHGVETFDPTPVLARLDGPFLRTDTHWRPEAMDEVAHELAELLDARLPRLAPTASKREPRRITSTGDIAAMLRLPADQQLYPPESVTIQAVARADGKPWAAEPSADVLVLGDSFSNIYSLGGMGWGEHAGFVETLSHYLQRPLDRIAINDAGAYKTRRALRDDLARGRDRLAGVKLVIWQFAIRELAVGDWRIIALPEVEVAAPSRDRAVVRGTVAERAAAPRPNSVPYRDCLLAVHLTGIEALEGELGDDEALVFVWGMRDNVWTDAARWPAGATIELELVPWSEVEGEVGSYNRKELEDDGLLLLDPWWGVPR